MAPRSDHRADPRSGPNLEARREAERRQAMVDLVRAARGGGLFSLPGQLDETDRQEILAKGEEAEAWKRLYGNARSARFGGAGRIVLLLGVLAALALGLLLLLRVTA